MTTTDQITEATIAWMNGDRSDEVKNVLRQSTIIENAKVQAMWHRLNDPFADIVDVTVNDGWDA